MPQTPHVKRHFTASDTIRDIVIGMADGLTVPFALTAELSGAVDSQLESVNQWFAITKAKPEYKKSRSWHYQKRLFF